MRSWRTDPEIRPWGSPGAVFGQLAGCWSIEKVIDNSASMTGKAAFELRPDGLLEYLESGRLRLVTGQAFDSHQRYLFQHRPGGLAVLFPEAPPRLFQDVVLRDEDGDWSGDGRHVCSDDLYESRYQFRRDGSFSIRHAVTGPRKAYTILTRYRRIPG